MKFEKGGIVVLKSKLYTFITINDGNLEVPNGEYVQHMCHLCIHDMNGSNYEWLDTNKVVFYNKVCEPLEYHVQLFKNALAKENKYYCEKTKTIKEIGANKEIIDFTSTNGLTSKIWESFKEEILSLKTKTIKEMKKKDLKSGMWVELRNGDRYMVIKDCDTMLHGKQCFCLITNDGYLISDEYTDCLTCYDSEYNEFDICAVYSTSGDVINGNTYTGEDMSVIWERSDSQDKIRAKIGELQRVIEELEAELI